MIYGRILARGDIVQFASEVCRYRDCRFKVISNPGNRREGEWGFEGKGPIYLGEDFVKHIFKDNGWYQGFILSTYQKLLD